MEAVKVVGAARQMIFNITASYHASLSSGFTVASGDFLMLFLTTYASREGYTGMGGGCVFPAYATIPAETSEITRTRPTLLETFHVIYTHHHLDRLPKQTVT
jgi:hypothetical protein